MERRQLISAALLCAAASLSAACAGGEASVSDNANKNGAPPNAKSSIGHAPSNTTAAPAAPAEAPGVTSSHGGGGASASPSGSPGQNRPALTSAIDAKIQKAVAKAKLAKAGEADKRAAADAYFERAEFYWSAGDPSLYKFAVADYRSVLHYQPENRKAREKLDELISIYKSMGRPVPDLSNEQ